ncbi:AMP-binding protein [Burkholderiaceae bacterium FT117]|uniref:AMP-binding protein n=1 Tax=Zeimonas sediminis TaxID=2944268 RepID=UPI002342DCF1|nr:AMP-binding protein [Zeimonas sediminis]MCM5570799.1 AMP-binding protein [Zeimonas sediminis]
MSTIAQLLKSRRLEAGGSPVLLASGRQPGSYADLSTQAEQCADVFRAAGLGRGSRIAVSLPNGPEAASAVLAIASCATCVPLNPDYRGDEFRFYLEDSRADAIVIRRDERGPVRDAAADLGLAVFELDTDPGAPAGRFDLTAAAIGAHAPRRTDESASDLSSPAADDVALILHTSGTTARPKIVPLSQANLVASAHSIAAHLALSPRDRGLNVMPLFHIHGLVGSLLSTIASGGSLACMPGFEAEQFFDWVAEFDPSWYTAVPTIHQAILAAGGAYRARAPLHDFRFVRSSSAALPPSTLAGLESLFGAPVVEAYGMTEASHQMATNPLPPRTRKPGTVGLPAGVEIAILDGSGIELAQGETGEIAIRGPGVTSGYENNPEANASAFTRGWFRTGDQGFFDADGYLRITGRLKEIVNRGGEKISPREIDEALLEHPEVAQATCFAVPHASLGEDLAAAVVPKAGCRPDEASLRRFLFGRVADYKVPSQIVLVDSIPKGPTGKIQRTSLHEKLGPALARPFEAPRTDTEAILESVFREVLATGPLGIHANFFLAGGDSLRGMQVVGRIRERLSVELPVVTLFRHPTVAELASAIDALAQPALDREAALMAEIDSMSDEEVARMLEEMERGDGR